MTLTYAYDDQLAVIGPLAPKAEPHSYDLCALHADRLTLPRGWQLLGRQTRELSLDPSKLPNKQV